MFLEAYDLVFLFLPKKKIYGMANGDPGFVQVGPKNGKF